jgi:hypothetical protein
MKAALSFFSSIAFAPFQRLSRPAKMNTMNVTLSFLYKLKGASLSSNGRANIVTK